MITKAMPTTLLAGILLVVVPNPASSSAAQSSKSPENRPVDIEMKNVTYHYSEPVAVHIVRLQGELLPTKAGSIVFFDDRTSFDLRLSYAEIAIRCSVLAQVLNENVFSAADAPVTKLGIASQNGQLVVTGKFHSKGDVPFETTGSPSADPDGKIRLHTEHVKAAHIPVRGLLDLLGIDLARLINTNKVHGVTVEKDDLILDPEEIFPRPRIRGKVTAVRIQGDEIVLTFGTSAQGTGLTVKQAGNFMAFRHGEMRFGKLTMHDADLTMIDIDPRDPFDFFLDHYQEQLVAGYTKSTPEYGLRAYTKDYNKLRARAVTK
jgi:hypothetical protein